jgi:hypothetical protein
MIALLQLVGIDATDAQCVHVHKYVRPARGVFNETESTGAKPGFQSSSGHWNEDFSCHDAFALTRRESLMVKPRVRLHQPKHRPYRKQVIHV